MWGFFFLEVISLRLASLQSPEGWDYSHEPPHLALGSYFLNITYLPRFFSFFPKRLGVTWSPARESGR